MEKKENSQSIIKTLQQLITKRLIQFRTLILQATFWLLSLFIIVTAITMGVVGCHNAVSVLFNYHYDEVSGIIISRQIEVPSIDKPTYVLVVASDSVTNHHIKVPEVTYYEHHIGQQISYLKNSPTSSTNLLLSTGYTILCIFLILLWITGCALSVYYGIAGLLYLMEKLKIPLC